MSTLNTILWLIAIAIEVVILWKMRPIIHIWATEFAKRNDAESFDGRLRMVATPSEREPYKDVFIQIAATGLTPEQIVQAIECKIRNHQGHK